MDGTLSRLTYLDAFSAAIFAGRLAKSGGDVREVAALAAAAPRPAGQPGPVDLLLDGFVATSNGEYAVGVPMLQAAVADFGNGMSAGDRVPKTGWLGYVRQADGGPEVVRPFPAAAWRIVSRSAWSADVMEEAIEELRWLWLVSVAAQRVWDDGRLGQAFNPPPSASPRHRRPQRTPARDAFTKLLFALRWRSERCGITERREHGQ